MYFQSLKKKKREREKRLPYNINIINNKNNYLFTWQINFFYKETFFQPTITYNSVEKSLYSCSYHKFK